MVISLGMRIQSGPWGGGNQFGASLAAFLRARGHQVNFDLHHPAIDVILLTEPRGELRSSAFTDDDIEQYQTRNTHRAVVVHRINECDERKGTHDVNSRLRRANRVADATVFISRWLRDLHLGQGMEPRGVQVILNGADTAVFHPHRRDAWNGNGPLRLVTHHWGANHQKGMDTYLMLDGMLNDPAVRQRLSFTYIGNLPADVRFAHTTVLTPLHGQNLAGALRSHHVYVTGSVHEPAGMHHIEGAACGLPLVYRRSGALPEYCADFGEGFDGPDFPDALRRLALAYHVWADRVLTYPYTAARMCEQYLMLFRTLTTRCACAGTTTLAEAGS
jgi:glycosyltransferase involved in cell wall biosynthesis